MDVKQQFLVEMVDQQDEVRGEEVMEVAVATTEISL